MEERLRATENAAETAISNSLHAAEIARHSLKKAQEYGSETAEIESLFRRFVEEEHGSIAKTVFFLTIASILNSAGVLGLWLLLRLTGVLR